MTAWMRIRDAVAAFGTNLNDVATVAHVLAGYTAMTLWPSWWCFTAVAIAGAVKEFYFDARDEKPKQTFLDNLIDWAGYVAGGLLGAWKVGLL